MKICKGCDLEFHKLSREGLCKECNSIRATERRQASLERKFFKGDPKISFCSCGDYYITKWSHFDKCRKCRGK